MKRTRWKIYGAILLAMLLLNLLAWNSRGFCDWYRSHIFPFWITTYGRFTGIFSFAVGEVLIVMGITVLILAIVFGIYLLIRTILKGFLKERDWKSILFIKKFYVFFAWVLLMILVVMTLNCFIPYHASTFGEKYFSEAKEEYTFEELKELREYIVNECNRLSALMERDEDGNILYSGDMEKEAIFAMVNLSEEYEGLSGFYPNPKPLFFSDIMSQEYMAGYYLPFSMEATYNDVMYFMNMPAVYCHELAHLKGFMYEDEANFVGFLACIKSEDIVFRYSGFLSVLYYVDNDFYAALGKDIEAYREYEGILPIVHDDNIFLTDEEWERIEAKALIDTETMDAVSTSFTDASLKLNGITDGMISYSRVVKLLLQYYDTKV